MPCLQTKPTAIELSSTVASKEENSSLILCHNIFSSRANLVTRLTIATSKVSTNSKFQILDLNFRATTPVKIILRDQPTRRPYWCCQTDTIILTMMSHFVYIKFILRNSILTAVYRFRLCFLEDIIEPHHTDVDVCSLRY